MGTHYGAKIIANGLTGYWPLAEYSWVGTEELNQSTWLDFSFPSDGIASGWEQGYAGVSPGFEIINDAGDTSQRVTASVAVSESGDYWRFSIKTSDSNFNPTLGSGLIYRVSGKAKYSSSNAPGAAYIAARMGGFTSDVDMYRIFPEAKETWHNFQFELPYGSVSDTNLMFVGQGIGYQQTGSWFEIDDIVVNYFNFRDVVGSNHGDPFNVPDTGSWSTTFNGTDDRIEFDSTMNGTTVSLWFKTISSAEQILMTQVGSGSYPLLALRSNKICNSYGQASTGVQTVRADFNDGEWHNITQITTDNAYPNTYRFFVDGVEEALETSTYQRTTSLFLLGCRYSSGAYSLFFEGELANAMTWNRELSEDEIWQNYTAMKWRFK